ncbi:MAG: DUF4292 domain-containing protein [Bacteroidales bacterium]|jgi:hypothetical protein|nr:DUF4292 domain-containing protein [Bacteroidales bacterium]
MKKFFLYFAVCAMALSLSGCRSSKQVAGGLDKEQLSAAKERYAAAIDRNFDFQYLQAKVRYSLDGGKTLSGKLYVEHGQRICMTVAVLGIEMARIEANRDEVMVVDKVDKVYARTSVADAATRLGLENEAQLEAVEALLLGRIYVPGRGIASKEDFGRLTWYPMENNELQADFVTEKYQLSYVIDGENRVVATQINVPEKNSGFVWEYAEPTAVENGWMPTQESLSATGKSPLNAHLALSNPSVGRSWTSFTPSANYREVTFAELIEIVKKLKN